MNQIDLFSNATIKTETVKSPICSYEKHCGAKATLGPPQREDGCTNRDIVCLQCGATGVQSTNNEETERSRR